MQPLALRIRNEFPIGKGFGSSAAARVAGIALAVHFGRLNWSDDRIVGEASRREHHPDNASACWMGGLSVARMNGPNEAQVACIKPKGKWPLLLAVPDEPLATEESRRVLPVQYTRADVVANIQNSMLLLAAFVQGRHDLLRSSLNDRVHQPYRSSALSSAARASEAGGDERRSGRGAKRCRPVGAGFSRANGWRACRQNKNHTAPRECGLVCRTDLNADFPQRRQGWPGLDKSKINKLYCLLAGGTIPFMRRYTTICP